MLNVDGWTDGRTNERTNGRKLARLCLPAKAVATKMRSWSPKSNQFLSLSHVGHIPLNGSRDIVDTRVCHADADNLTV